MDAPQIRYLQSADGTRIAVATAGSGRPLVYMPFWSYTIEMLSEIPEVAANLTRLAEKRAVVMYDARGAGLSSRKATDFSFEARVADLEAVVDSLGPTRIDLIAGTRLAPVAIAFAARHGERMHRLVLPNGLARGADSYGSDERLQAMEPLALVDWELYLYPVPEPGALWLDRSCPTCV